MKTLILILAAVSLPALWQHATQPSNSKAATERGSSAFQRQQYGLAAKEFATVVSADASPASLFNLGTAQIAAGQRAEGAATLAKAMSEESLRADALFNRGNGALASNALDHAIRDYTEALKLAPGDPAAKRNLEIALRKQQSDQQQKQSGGQQNEQQAPASQPPQTDPQQSPDRGREEKGESDAEALLRSVQQQEQEELARMKRARGDSRRVGW